MCICNCLCDFVYIFGFLFSCKIDRLMGGGRLRRPPLINYQFDKKKIKKYTQKHTMNMQIHIKMYRKI